MGNKSQGISLKNSQSSFTFDDENKQLMQQVFTQRIRIADQINISQAIKDEDILNLQFYFQIRCYSIIQGINHFDQNKYQSSLHLAFELSKFSAIEYFFALKQCQNIDDRIFLLKDYRGQDIFDICISKGNYLVKYLVKFQIQTYSENFINYCLNKKIFIDNGQILKQMVNISKFNLKQEFVSTYFAFEDNQLNYNLVIKKNPTFKLYRISEILNVQIQNVKLFPKQMLSQHINQSVNLGNCYLISVIKATIKSQNEQLIYDIFQNKQESYHLSFSGQHNLKLYSEGQEIVIQVDDRFLYDIKNKQSYASQISIDSVYFNILEKAWIKKLGGFFQDLAYSVDFCILDLFNTPVISIDLNKSFKCENSKKQLFDILKSYFNNGYLVVATTKRNIKQFQNIHHSLNLSEVQSNDKIIFEDTGNSNCIIYTFKQFFTDIEYLSIGVVRKNYLSRQKKIKMSKIIKFYIESSTIQKVNFSMMLPLKYQKEFSLVRFQISENNLILFSNNLEIDKYYNFMQNSEQGLNNFFQIKNNQQKYQIIIEFTSEFNIEENDNNIFAGRKIIFQYYSLEELIFS
ncbi:hypothetical protein ABPG74_000202 [Tetrahymena malaccensis]